MKFSKRKREGESKDASSLSIKKHEAIKPESKDVIIPEKQSAHADRSSRPSSAAEFATMVAREIIKT
ncbi:MAG: hypothetical protein N3A54_06080, partial [Patescibacteria group bacterium]|nr:hypothetical protein [Patescibacteria group bacterium]